MLFFGFAHFVLIHLLAIKQNINYQFKFLGKILNDGNPIDTTNF